MSKSKLKLNCISSIFTPAVRPQIQAGNINVQLVLSAALGSLSLEQASIKWSNPEFLNTIFALVIKNKEGKEVVLKKDCHDISFKYTDSSICVVFEDDLAFSYEVQAVLCKDRSGLEIANGKIRHMNSGKIYEYANGLKVFVKPEEEIKKLEVQTEDRVFEPKNKKSKHLLGEEDVRLLNEAIAGNTNSLAMYFNRLRNRLIGYAKISNIDEAKSEDAVQEAFIVIFKKMAEGDWNKRDFKSPFQLAKFIGAVIRNRAFNIGKLACNRHETSLDDGLEEIDPDKQEHHISIKNTYLDSNLDFLYDPQSQLETFDAALFLEAIGKYTERNNTPPLSMLREFIIAHLGSGGECTEHKFSKGLGITTSQFLEHLETARVELERVGLGRQAMIEGKFPSPLSTVRLASSYQYE